MYQALYRKYRPKTFDDVVGQDVIVKILKNTIINNKINHAYLFTGPRGTGKTSIAKLFAKTINCADLNGVQTCEKCQSCEHFNAKQNVDIIEIDAASNNGVDEIREIRNKINLVPSYSKYKVYIIDEVHMLTQGAFNALLKTLEEPPSHTIFVLATTEPHKIPATILSRCQRMDFKRISIDFLVERLKHIVLNENIEIGDEALNEIARLSDGGMRDSIGMLDQVIAFSNDKITIQDVHEVNGTLTQEDLQEFIVGIAEGNLNELLQMMDKYLSRGKSFIKLTEEIILFLRNILLVREAPDYCKSSMGDFVSLYNDININDEDIMKYITCFNEALNEMKKTVNYRMIFEITLLKILKKDNVSDAPNVSVSNVNTKGDNSREIKVKQDDTKKVSNIRKCEIDKNFIDLRINNTLAELNKKEMISIINNLNMIKQYMFDGQFESIVPIILEGKLKAASEKYIIFVFDDVNNVKIFNENVYIVEELFQKCYNKSYKVISVSDAEWTIVKNEFNSKKKVYQFIEEKENDFGEMSINNNEIESLFDGIIKVN